MKSVGQRVKCKCPMLRRDLSQHILHELHCTVGPPSFFRACANRHVTDHRVGVLLLSYSRTEREEEAVAAGRQAGRHGRDLRGHGKKAKSEEFMIMNICGGRKRKVVSGLGKVTYPAACARAPRKTHRASRRLSQFRPFIRVPNSKTVSVPLEIRWMSPMIRETVEMAGGHGKGGEVGGRGREGWDIKGGGRTANRL